MNSAADVLQSILIVLTIVPPCTDCIIECWYWSDWVRQLLRLGSPHRISIRTFKATRKEQKVSRTTSQYWAFNVWNLCGWCISKQMPTYKSGRNKISHPVLCFDNLLNVSRKFSRVCVLQLLVPAEVGVWSQHWHFHLLGRRGNLKLYLNSEL